MKQHWKLCKKLRNVVTSGKANAALKKVNPVKNTSSNPQSPSFQYSAWTCKRMKEYFWANGTGSL